MENSGYSLRSTMIIRVWAKPTRNSQFSIFNSQFKKTRFYDFLVNFITILLHFNAKFSIINTDKL
jgi:hypothetical protein